MTYADKGKVYLVGAGPGDPDLLTVRASDLLRTADVIYHDDLVPSAVLGLAPEAAEVTSVGKRCGAKRITQSEINAKMIGSARSGKAVVRLKSGDPLIFGRAAEEISALAGAGIACEVVPGITAALAAAALLRCSLTDRRTASSVLFLTGHHAEELNPTLPPTRIVYMPGADLSRYAKTWLGEGDSPLTPCVLLGRVAQHDQSVFRTTLKDLHRAEIPATPVILMAGWALG